MLRCKLQKKLHMASGEMQISFNLTIPLNSITAITGPSGGGKSTLLHMLAGLSLPDKGYIKTNQTLWFDSATKINLSPQERPIGVVFQNYALFPHLSVLENIMYAARDTSLVADLLEIMELTKLKDCYPGKLSGGQQQRVALARTLATKAEWLLLDEPLSALDHQLRQKLQKFLKKFCTKNKSNLIIVSHDHYEMKQLAERILLIEDGRIITKN